MRYDVIVVGGGHAGCEAAAIAARLGRRVALVSQRRAHIGRLSCNPAIGGQAKGHLVREIDALGGLMGRAADATCLQFRRLNTRRGLAVQASRAQVDVDLYPRWIQSTLAGLDGLELVEGEVEEVLVRSGRVVGVRLADGSELPSATVVLTAGTFLAGVMHRGSEQEVGGRIGEGAAQSLAASLQSLGLRMGRLKTGTVPRLAAESVDWHRLEPQRDTVPDGRFSYSANPEVRLPQVVCFAAYTNEATHEVIRGRLGESPLFTGAITGRGPRYCPSIEDKVVRFADRGRHLLFLEPEGLATNRIYVNGLSTSLPADAQLAVVRSIEGLERAEILQYGYAVEYAYNDPTQLDHGLQHRDVPGLYLAGQVNGTSGYEEAAAQGLVAGLSASLGETFHVERSEAYLGVLVDDLVTRGVGGEPYRMFSSRAEHRLLLREDNADQRLMSRGRALGLVDEDTWRAFEAREAEARQLFELLRSRRVTPTEATQQACQAAGFDPLSGPTSLAELLARPEATWERLASVFGLEAVTRAVAERVETDLKYAPYVAAAQRKAKTEAELEGLELPLEEAWMEVPGLSREVAERLLRHRPRTVGQAARLPGVTPAAVSVLVVLAGRAARRDPVPRPDQVD